MRPPRLQFCRLFICLIVLQLITACGTKTPLSLPPPDTAAAPAPDHSKGKQP